MSSIGYVCSFAQAVDQSLWGMLWSVISWLWPWNWIYVVLFIGIWIAVELITRNGTIHYNSENGFSPAFNRFVGAGTYAGLQALLFVFMHLLLGDFAYCIIWPYAVHAVLFLSTGLLLHLSGFWPYLREPGQSRRRYRKTRRY